MTCATHKPPLMVALRLADAPVLVVGGGSVALQRTKALLRAGARPLVVASEANRDILQLSVDEHIRLELRRVRDADIANHSLVLVAIDDAHRSRELATLARRQRIPINVADVPELCDFYFCAVHQQGDLQIAVSTNGKGPGLAGRLRDEIAARLPRQVEQALTRFSQLRHALRENKESQLKSRMQTLGQLARSLSWQELATLRSSAPTALLQIPATTVIANRPSVSLVGSGPGDPELLTVRAKRLLEEADLVIADRLIPPDLLALVQCELRVADKAPGRADLSQQEIDSWMLDAVGKGQQVVRLKIGDPYLFGRGGEEVEFLGKHGISVDVVPGITSAFAAPLAAGIPVTQRGVADRLCIFTAKGRDNTTPLPPSFSQNTTFLVLMGMGSLPTLVPALLRQGFPPDLPTACVVAATRPDEQVIRGPLHALAALVAEAGLKPPGILVFGEVAATAAASQLAVAME